MTATTHERSLVATILGRASSYQWLASSLGYMQTWIDADTSVAVWHPSTFRKPDVCDVADRPSPLLYKVIAGEIVYQKFTRCLPGKNGLQYRRMSTSEDKIVHINTITLLDGDLVEYTAGNSFFVNAIDISKFLAKDGTVLIVERVSKGESARSSMFIESGKPYVNPETWVPDPDMVQSICRKSIQRWFQRI